MKNKIRFVCNECGYTSTNWLGKCPECFSWNSFIEESIQSSKNIISNSNKSLININDIKLEIESTVITNNKNINDFFGDGIISGSVTLITGEPGIGKSTFLLFLANIFPENIKIYYFSGEESLSQIKKRCERLKVNRENLFISNQIDTELIIKQCKDEKPNIIFIDSIQTCYSSKIDSLAGTVTQIKNNTSILIQLAKEFSIPIIIIGHITKSGEIAGPKIMEHMVDVVINFQGDMKNNYRILRSEKNRYGSIDDIILFEMKENGLILIDNPSNFFLDINKEEKVSLGKCKAVIIEGKRPIVIEVEALAVPSIYSNPRRFSEGVDISRINRIAAIIDKHLNENLNNYDIYFNIPSGIKTKDAGIDLAIAIAIYSSKNKKYINNDYIFIGELSLTGNLREVFKIDNRIKEAKKFGFNFFILPKSNIKDDSIELKIANDINSSVKYAFQ